MRRHYKHRAATALSAATALIVLLGVLVGVVTNAGKSTASSRLTAPQASRVARWTEFVRVRRPLDLAGPRSDGALALAADARLLLLTPEARVRPVRSGPRGYLSPGGEEPYIALASGWGFGTGTVYALRLAVGRGVVAISVHGSIHRLARLAIPGLLDGITFDQTGRFGHRLLVTSAASGHTIVVAIDPRGVVSTITRDVPTVEGGIAVAPRTFGRFAGDLIASSETSGRIFAITPQGTSALVANSQLPDGSDIGVESEGFVPRDPHADAFLADRLTPGNPHPGDDAILRIRATALVSAGVRPGDLLVGTEGCALTDDVSPAGAGYRVRLVARGPAVAHAEGHIAFARSH